MNVNLNKLFPTSLSHSKSKFKPNSKPNPHPHLDPNVIIYVALCVKH